MATLDFFVDAVRDERLRDALAQRYRQARASAGAGIAAGVADEAGAGPDQGGATTHEGQIGLGVGPPVGDGGQQRRVETTNPGQVVGERGLPA